MPERNSNRNFRAIFFDLDGTLLPIDVDVFMKSYFKLLGGTIARLGVNPDTFMAGMQAGTMGMVTNDAGIPNADAFWPAFWECVNVPTATGVTKEQLLAAFDSFYENAFGTLGAEVKPNPAAARAINTLAAKGYPLVLTTMPMFPRRAVEWRLSWAGIDPAVFSRITTYENSTAVKPKPNYYAENLAACGLSGADVLMVGNNTKEDLAACKLGCDGYLITDFLIDPVEFDLSTVNKGSLEDFANWVEQLPDCGNPATDVTNNLVPAADREAALAAAGVADGSEGGSTTLEEAGKSGGADLHGAGM